MATHLPHLFEHHAHSGPPLQFTGDVVEFDNVSISFGRTRVLRKVSFRIAAGETRVLLGPAGVGKSVLLKLINGLLAPDSGTIRVFGETIAHNGTAVPESDLFPLRRQIGMVFQESALFDSLSVRDNVGYRLDEEKLPPEESDARVQESLNFVELGDTMQKFPPELSGGMRRRVSIARAIVTHPALLLYDSPTGGLDPITSATIVQLVIKQRDMSHTTSVVVTHRLQDAFSIATHRYNQQTDTAETIPSVNGLTGLDPQMKYLVLHDGRVVFDGDTHALIDSTDPWLKEFLT